MAGVPYVAALLIAFAFAAPLHAEVVLQNPHLRVVITDAGEVQSVLQVDGERELVPADAPAMSAFAVHVGEETFPAASARREGDRIAVSFQGIDTTLQLMVLEMEQFMVLEVAELAGAEVDRVDILALRLAPMPQLGTWINIAYDDDFGVALFAGVPNVNATMQRPGQDRPWVDLTTTAHRVHPIHELDLEGSAAVLMGCPRPAENFLDFMAVAEEHLGLPPGARGRQSEQIKYSYLWVSPTTQNIDELIEWAKRGGFRMMLYSYEAYSRTVGHFPWRETYPNEMADLKEVADKIRAAGMALGLHIHYNKAHKADPYVTPVPDDRLNIVRHFTLAEALDEGARVIRVNENPQGCTMDDERRLLKIDKEIVEYAEYTTEPPYEFRGCRRGALNTTVSAHEAGAPLGLLDVDTWPIFIRFNQDTDIQEEAAARIAAVVGETGPYDMIYFDGAEDVHAPFWFHCANAKWRVYRHLEPPPPVAEGAAATHFSWHMFTRSNAYDSVRPSEMKDFCRRNPARRAPQRAVDFSKINFGWLHGFARADNDNITPDILEFILSRGAAWDCPFSMTFNLNQAAAHPRPEDCFDVIKIWEDARIEGRLSREQKDALKDLDQEHHLFINEDGEYELVPIRQLDGVAGGHAPRAWLFTRETEPGAAYAILWEDDDAELIVDFPAARLTLLRPFGVTLEGVREEEGRTRVMVGSRRYLRFEGLGVAEAGGVLQRARSSLGPFARIWLRASDLADKNEAFALGSEVGREQEGAFGDVIVPVGPADMSGEGDSYVDYTVDIPARGRWFVWGRVWYRDTNTNSLHLSVPGVHDGKLRFGNSFVWERWLWEVGGPVRLDEGPATIRFSIRESGPGVSPLLDVICITNESRFHPTDAHAREGLAE